jgi:hypothetical protein
MQEDEFRILPVKEGRVQCLPGKEETIDHCRFCVYSRYFRVDGIYVKSPSLAYCVTQKACEEVDLDRVEAVKCADRRREGYRSMMNIIG